MRALHIVEAGRPLEEVTVPTPTPDADEVLVQVEAAGICRTDVHYRRGPHTVRRFPMTPGHEIAGTVVAVGAEADERHIGRRIAVHYQTSCGRCRLCRTDREQFCEQGSMIGRGRHGGYADYVVVPQRNVYVVPDSVSTEHAAVMMCSSATSLHALNLGRLRSGERVAVFGCGGLGMSAIQIAAVRGADVFAVDLDPAKLALAAELGAVVIDPAAGDVCEQIEAATAGQGIDVALELVGVEKTVRQAVDVLGVGGRAVIAGIGGSVIELAPVPELVMREAEIIGVADHLGAEIPPLLAMAARGELVLDHVVTSCVRLEERAVNAAMDRLEAFGEGVRTVIIPAT